MANAQTRGEALWEATKFAARMALLVFTPLVVQWSADFTGVWHDVFSYALPVLLPIIDKWVHVDPRITAKGIVPF